MAAPANTYATTSIVGIREKLLDNIWMLSPSETPFLSAIGKDSTTNTLHEWQTDALPAARSDNAHPEGDDVSADAIVPTVRVGNRTQIFRESARVSGTAEATDRAGRERELTKEMAKKMKVLKLSMSMSIFENQAKVAGSNTVAGRLAGIPAWIKTNTSAGAGGANPAGTGVDARTDGTLRTFTEAMLTTVLQSRWQNVGDAALVAYVGANVKKTQSSFTGAATIYQDRDAKKLAVAVNVYESDFGTVTFRLERNVRARDCIIVDHEMWKWTTLRPIQEVEIAKTGDSTAKYILTEATLTACNEQASAGVFDLQ